MAFVCSSLAARVSVLRYPFVVPLPGVFFNGIFSAVRACVHVDLLSCADLASGCPPARNTGEKTDAGLYVVEILALCNIARISAAEFPGVGTSDCL